MLARNGVVTAVLMSVLGAIWAPPPDDNHRRGGKVGGGVREDLTPSPTQRVTPPPSSAESAASDEAGQRRAANSAMERYSTGDPAAFRELYHLTSERLLQYLRRRIADRVRAEDLLQQTFLHMHQARGRFTPGADVFPWMYAIAHRLVIDLMRRGGREVSIEPSSGGGPVAPEPVCAEGGADELLIARQLEESIERALGALPESQRSAYELIRLEGLTYREAAEALGTTVAAVTSLLHRAVESLHRARERQED